MKKFILVFALSMLIPFSAAALARAPVKTSPLQPIPDNTAPTINANINSPGNDYNTAQSQIESQSPENTANPDNVSATAPQASGALPVSQIGSNSTFYVVLIIVCSICLVLMLGYIYFRFRKKE